MDSRSVPAIRTSAENLIPAIEAVASDPVVCSLLECVGGMLAILDENRQILALNPRLLELMDMDAGRCLGLRPGEFLGCVHATESSGGCGTTKWCASCGAALAIVSSRDTGVPVERDCVLERESGSDLFLRVRSAPLQRDGRSLTAIFLNDITQEQNRRVLESSFFHDIRDLITGVVGNAEMLADDTDIGSRRRIGSIQDAAMRLAHEIDLQSLLVRENDVVVTPRFGTVRAEDLLRELSDLFRDNPIQQGIAIEVGGDLPSRPLRTDGGIVLRVLRNMLTNALEASVPGEIVLVTCREESDSAIFEVSNPAVIPPEIQLRVFQRNFSTKGGGGRGLGTWSMRFFGEKLLGGKVSFSSEQGQGTVFRLQIKA
jgi:signal transduction histidine kinase